MRLQVVAVAVNSGLVMFPVSYSVAYKTSGLTIWSPEPPAGYAALGCLANPGDDPPALTEVACIATGIGERAEYDCKGLPWRIIACCERNIALDVSGHPSRTAGLLRYCPFRQPSHYWH